MITFESRGFHRKRDGSLYLKYEDIEKLTTEIIEDYEPSLLSNPHAIEYDDFLECYLGVNLLYQDIYSPTKDDIILGCAVFNRQAIPVFDKDAKKSTFVVCKPRTVIIDNSVTSGDRKIQENITGLHEGGHIWMHTEQFTEMEGQLSFRNLESAICCRKSDILNTGKPDKISLSNGETWIEWQANVFAVTIALPKKSLNISVRELFKKYGVDTEALIIDADKETYYLSEHVIPGELRGIYNMSKESIRYRLSKAGFYTTKKKYEEEHAYTQMSLFDIINTESIPSYQ